MNEKSTARSLFFSTIIITMIVAVVQGQAHVPHKASQIIINYTAVAGEAVKTQFKKQRIWLQKARQIKADRS